MLIDSPEEFAAKKYDYVIVGGGTAGLTLAARLTEDPNIRVGVIEAGQNRLADPNILVPGCMESEIHLELQTDDNSGL
jgi:choline dehydrogenase